MPAKHREARAVAGIACPRCGAAKGQPCLWGEGRPGIGRGPACCSERRQAWQTRERDVPDSRERRV